MDKLHDKRIALPLCALMLCLAVIFGSHMSLTSLRGRAEQIFFDGSDGSGMGIQYDLDEIAAEALNITVIAGRYLPAGDEMVSGTLAGREALIRAEFPGEKYAAAQELTAAARELYQALAHENLGTQDANLLQKCIVNIDSHNMAAARTGYNEAAGEFNRARNRFPANFLGGLTGVAPLELYA